MRGCKKSTRILEAKAGLFLGDFGEAELMNALPDNSSCWHSLTGVRRGEGSPDQCNLMSFLSQEADGLGVPGRTRSSAT